MRIPGRTEAQREAASLARTDGESAHGGTPIDRESHGSVEREHGFAANRAQTAGRFAEPRRRQSIFGTRGKLDGELDLSR